MGESMSPAIPDHSLVVMQRTQDVKIGDIIVFNHRSYSETASELICHRIVDQTDICFKEGSCYITKGDANPDPDLLFVHKEDIIGVVIYHIPFLSFFLETYIYLPIAVFLVILFIVVLARIRKKATRAVQ